MRPGDDAEALRALATPLALDRQDPASLDLLGVALLAADDVEDNIDLLAALQQRRPDDTWTNLRLSRAYERLDPPRIEEALRFAEAALALQPTNAALRVNVARKHLEHGRQRLRAGAFAEAREEFVLTASDPVVPRALADRAGALAGRAAELVALEPAASRVLDGTWPAAADAECALCGDFCVYRGAPVAALGWFRRASGGAGEPAFPEAARAAVLAGFGVGDGQTLDEGRRTHLRQQGLAAWMRRREGLAQAEKRQMARDLLNDLQLATVRADETLERLRAEERDSWQDFWDRTRQLAGPR